MNGTAKSLRALGLSAWHCTHPELDSADKALLSYLATYAKLDGSSAHPGNRNIADALGLKDSATDVRIKKNIARGLIERTERANGRNRASCYRLCVESPFYPDQTPGGEHLTTRLDHPSTEEILYKPPGADRADSLDRNARLGSGNRPVELPKPPGQEVETARSRPTTNKNTTNTQPPNGVESEQGGGQSLEDSNSGRLKKLMIDIPPEMQTAPLNKNHTLRLQKQITEHGAEKLAIAISAWARHRELPIESLNKKWDAWFNEGSEYLNLSAEMQLRYVNEKSGCRWTFDYYVARINRDPKRCLFTSSRERLLMDRLKELELSMEWEPAVHTMCHCIDAMSQSDWHMGRDPRTNGRTFNELENCFARDKFQQWRAQVQDAGSGTGDHADDLAEPEVEDGDMHDDGAAAYG